ncbi:MAG: LytR C-terminal domain-containing protein [Gaiellaceae bacterium]
MEHAHSVNRPFSWRGGALAIALCLVIALAGLGGMALLHRFGGTAPAAHAGQTPTAAAVRLHPRSAISVLVLNGNGINGAAGDIATRLVDRGYAHAIPTDAPNHDYARSLVLFRRGWEGEANRLAKDARIAAVAPLDGRLAPAYARDQLIVILGR